MSSYELKVIRATYLEGQPVERGARLTLDATTAKQLVDCGKAEMVNAYQVAEMHSEVALGVSRRMQIDSRLIATKTSGISLY